MHENGNSRRNGKHRWLRIVIPPIVVLGTIAALALPKAGIWAQTDNNGSTDVSADIQTIRNLVAAFNTKDVDAIMEFFTEDAVYHNMPMGPVQGTEGVRGLITGFIGPAETLNWEILNIAQTGNTVLAERIDRFVINGKDVVLPCLGAFDMRDGKIAEWRDYFDMATWTKQNAQ